MHLQQNLSFPLKITPPPPQAGGSGNSLKRWVYLSLSHEFVTTQLSVVILESLALAMQELPSSAEAEYSPLCIQIEDKSWHLLGGVGESLISFQSLRS